MAARRSSPKASEPPTILGVRLTEIDNAASFHEEGRYQGLCASCARGGPFEVHHALQKQRCRREHAPLYSPDNALRLCPGCHADHTTHSGRLPVACLRDANIAFMVNWLGSGPAHQYLTRYYHGGDSRLDAILEIDR